MYDYKFIRIGLKGGLNPQPAEDYSKIVEEHAKEGWRLVQMFAPPIVAYGKAPYIEIILEREKL